MRTKTKTRAEGIKSEVIASGSPPALKRENGKR
jgi:hypothetical protein